jgi:hypothetical protein
MAKGPRDPVLRHPADRVGLSLLLGLMLIVGSAGAAVALAKSAPLADKADPRPRHVRTYMAYPAILYIPGRGTPRQLRGGGPGLGK